MSAPPPWPWNFARLQKRPRYASWPIFGSASQNPTAEKRDLTKTDRLRATLLPICFEKALRQLCRPLECFSDDGGSSSH